MTRVYCSKKLKDFVGHVEETLPGDFNDIKLSDWNAHLFFVDKRKCIVFVNLLTSYAVFIADIVKNDLKNIDDIFIIRLKEQLLHDKVVDDFQSARFLTDGEKIHFFKTNNNKRVIGRINDYVYSFKLHCIVKYGHLKEMNVVHENGLINDILINQFTGIKKTWISPIKNVIDKLNSTT